jgi:hypothetical protein
MEYESSCSQTEEPASEEQVASESFTPASALVNVDLSTSPPRSPTGSFHHPLAQQGKLYKGFYSTEHVLTKKRSSQSNLLSQASECVALVIPVTFFWIRM